MYTSKWCLRVVIIQLHHMPIVIPVLSPCFLYHPYIPHLKNILFTCIREALAWSTYKRRSVCVLNMYPPLFTLDIHTCCRIVRRSSFKCCWCSLPKCVAFVLLLVWELAFSHVQEWKFFDILLMLYLECSLGTKCWVLVLIAHQNLIHTHTHYQQGCNESLQQVTQTYNKCLFHPNTAHGRAGVIKYAGENWTVAKILMSVYSALPVYSYSGKNCRKRLG